MLFLASSCLILSQPAPVADGAHCGLWVRLTHTFTLCSLPTLLLQMPESEVSRCARSSLLCTGKGEEELEVLRNRFAAALHYYGSVHKTARLPVFCQCGDTMWPPKKILSARRMALDKWHPHSVTLVLLENRQTLPDVGTAAFYHFNLTMDVFRSLKSMLPIF